jgi:ligand-binding SRPBCC domain-containing protein
MYTYYYNTDQFLPIDINKAWRFFSEAKNLALITPPEMDFKILTSLTDKAIYEGMLINYRVKPLFHIPLYWQTEICKVQYPLFFTDRQLKGPYKLWEHTHTFVEKDNGVLMKDTVKYQLPFGIIGKLVHSLIVQKKIENIFIYRKNVLNKIFDNHGKNNH